MRPTKLKAMPDEFPRFVDIAQESLRSIGLEGHPDAVETLATVLLAEIEHERQVIAGRLAEVAEARKFVTRLELEWIILDVREAPRDTDGGFGWHHAAKVEDE